MTPEKSLRIINEFIEKSRRDFVKDSARSLIVWGVLVFVTSLAVWYLWQKTSNAAWNWLWFVMAAAGFALMPLYDKRGRPKAKNYLGESISYIWLSFGIFAMSYALAAMFLAPLPITAGNVLMLGLCISLTGTLTKVWLLSAIGLVSGIGGAVSCSLIPSSVDVTLVMTFMSFLIILTGLIMNYRYGRLCSRN